jgi:hypothetical protein
MTSKGEKSGAEYSSSYDVFLIHAKRSIAVYHVSIGSTYLSKEINTISGIVSAEFITRIIVHYSQIFFKRDVGIYTALE